jgi:hypothetical protein
MKSGREVASSPLAPRMMRKFIERSHECGHAVRGEIATAFEPTC